MVNEIIRRNSLGNTNINLVERKTVQKEIQLEGGQDLRLVILDKLTTLKNWLEEAVTARRMLESSLLILISTKKHYAKRGPPNNV
jgi:hypothetical protein